MRQNSEAKVILEEPKDVQRRESVVGRKMVTISEEAEEVKPSQDREVMKIFLLILHRKCNGWPVNMAEQSSKIHHLETSPWPQYRHGWQEGQLDTGKQELAAIIQMRQGGRAVVTMEIRRRALT